LQLSQQILATTDHKIISLSTHNYSLGLWIVQRSTSPPTQYRLYGRRFLQVKRLNQQYQSTEGDATKEQESPAHADKPARRGSMQKLLQFNVFRFISPNSISPNFKLPVHGVMR